MVKERNVYLPQELVEEILLRSPVKFLSRCKCVSRNWCSLIESPSFIKQHFESSRERLLVRLRKKHGQEGNESDTVVTEPVGNESDTVDTEPFEIDDEMILDEHEFFRRVFLETQRYKQMIYDEGSKYALYVDDTFSEYEDPAHLQIPDSVSDVFGPLNGVFCVASEFPWGPMALLNPALRQFMPIPDLVQQHMVTEGTISCDCVLGMGLDPLTGDIKLVSILYFTDLDSDDRDFKCYVSVCTSDSDSWRALDQDVDSILLGPTPQASLCNTYINGAYYWIMTSCNPAIGTSIVAFDMRTDKFRKIQMDGRVDPKYVAKGCLTLYRDSLALLIYDDVSSCTDIWLMVNEGCWIKNARVGPLQEFRRLLLYWKDELLFETKAAFLSQCNVYSQELKTFEVKRFDVRSRSQWVYPYKESLVSIKGKAGSCKLWDTSSSDFVKKFFEDSSSEGDLVG